MAICRFFLQGNCKFGDYCKNSHQINEPYKPQNNQSSMSILRQPSAFGTSNAPSNPQPSNVDTSALIKSVANDMTGIEKGGQWLLSSYAPFKDKSPFPGFEDYSCEELRHGYYEAMQNGTLEEYKNQVQAIVQQQISRVKALQAPSPDVVNVLREIYNGVPQSAALQYTAAPQQQQNPSSIFGQQQPPPPYGQSGAFSQVNQNILVQQPQQTQTSSIFGAQPVSPFGSNQAQAQPLAQNNPTFNASPFGQGQPNQSVNTGSLFALQQSQNQDPTRQNIFGPAEVTQIPLPNPTLNSNRTSSVFGQAVQSAPISNSPFGQAQAHSSSIFGNATIGTGQLAGGDQSRTQIDETLYSKLEDLTQEEINWFQSDDLTIMNIPENPPTYEMCFPSSTSRKVA